MQNAALGAGWYLHSAPTASSFSPHASPLKDFKDSFRRKTASGYGHQRHDIVRMPVVYCGERQKKKGQKLSSVDCLDIINIIATIVVAGNVRRSALVSLGDYDDIEYLKAKNWSSGNIPNWRCMSNNSVVCTDTSKLPEEFWDGYNGTSEPYGLINLELSRKLGRLKNGEIYKDPDVQGYNPCCEISLNNFVIYAFNVLFIIF